MREGDALALREIPKAFTDTSGAAETEFYIGETSCCNRCKGLRTMSVLHVNIVKDENDKLQRSESPLIRHLLISEEHLKKLHQRPWEPEKPKVLPPAVTAPNPTFGMPAAITTMPTQAPTQISTAIAGPPAAHPTQPQITTAIPGPPPAQPQVAVQQQLAPSPPPVPEVHAKPDGLTFSNDAKNEPATTADSATTCRKRT